MKNLKVGMKLYKIEDGYAEQDEGEVLIIPPSMQDAALNAGLKVMSS